MTSKFRQLMVSDSDEDSTDHRVMERREQRSNATGSAQATPPPQPATVLASAPPASSKAGSGRHTPLAKASVRSASVTSPLPAVAATAAAAAPVPATSRNGSEFHFNPTEATDATSVAFSVDPTPSRTAGAAAPPAPPLSASQHSINFNVLTHSTTPSLRNGSVDSTPAALSRGNEASARITPRAAVTPAAAVSAPHDETASSISFAFDNPSARNSSQHAIAAASGEKGTSAQSSAASLASDGQKKKHRVVRRKVVVRRRKGGDPNDPGEVLHVKEGAIRPGRDGPSLFNSATSRAPQEQQVPPLPFRVSPRAQHAAESRSASRMASRAHTPAEGSRTPRAGQAEAPPQVPLSRPASRAVTPRTPRGGHGESFPPLSARRSSRHATPRTPAESVSDALQFQTEDPNGHTDDTISFNVEGTNNATPQRTASRQVPSHRHPQIPSPSAFDDAPTPYAADDKGQQVMMHRAKVQLTKTADGRQAWVLLSPHVGDRPARVMQEIASPPKKLSQRAQDIMAVKRRSVEEAAKRRHAEAVQRTVVEEVPPTPTSVTFQLTSDSIQPSPAAESTPPRSEASHRPTPAAKKGPGRLSIARRTRTQFSFPPTAFFAESIAQEHRTRAVAGGNREWVRHIYDNMPICAGVCEASAAPASRREVEKVMRALQPVQVAPTSGSGAATGSGSCGCVVYDPARDDALRQLLESRALREEGVRRYLNLQPMQLANVEMQDMVDPPLESPRRDARSASEAMNGSGSVPSPKASAEARGVATLGGLWCTAEALREDGRPVTRKDASAPRRILRICGGQALGVPLRPDNGETLDVRCYELLLFPREALSPSAVNYGSEGLTLGQLIAPPASSFPLTPRIIDDPVMLKEYKKRLLTTKNAQISMVNNEDDRETFASAVGGAGTSAGHYLTLTMVTISSRQKFTIELTLVQLPFRSSGIFGGKTVAEVPRFCPTTVMTYRRLQGLSLSFSTQTAFMSAYKALLWATECDIVDVQPGEDEDAASAGLGYSRLRVCATSSPMVPWVSSFGHTPAGQPREETYHGNCLDFAVLTLAAPPRSIQKAEVATREPLTLEDFIITDTDAEEDKTEDGARSEVSGTTAAGRGPQRRSSIFTSTLIPPRKVNAEGEEDANALAPSMDNLVGLTPYGVIRRAVSQKTSEVFDVRVMPRNRGRMAPTHDGAANAEWREAGGQTVKAQQEHLLQQDVEAAIMMEYASRLPFHSRVYGVLVDEQRYYVFQEPWISALALEQSVTGTAERDAVEYNADLKSMTRSTAVMSLKDFVHGILRPSDGPQRISEEVKLQVAHVLAAQLLLLITSAHGKGMLLGPCPPQRLLVRIEEVSKDAADDEEHQETVVDTPEKGKQKKPASQLQVTSHNIQLFLPDIGVNTLAWSYERQQCGVLEYLPPMYVLEQMLVETIGKEERSWTVHDDWWTYLTLCFELFAGDGMALVAPKTSALAPTPAPTLTKFFSPVDIVVIWQEAITDPAGGAAETAAETIAVRVRRYVRQRVLKSVSRSVDSWIATKAEELQCFGTTAARRTRRVVRAVPPSHSPSQNRPIGVSLAAAYLQSARETSETSSIAFQMDDDEAGGGSGESANVLEDMPWVFQLRDFFDTILDAVFTQSGFCAVHGPALCLASHPFFRTLQLPAVFDGSHVFSRAVAQFAKRQLTKAKVQATLLAYRTRAYRGPAAARPEGPLLITGSAYNAAGGFKPAASLLMLSSPAFQEELNPGEGDTQRRFSNDAAAAPEAWPADGLVFSRTNSMSQGLNNAYNPPSPRMQSPAAAPWSQQKLRAMYRPNEWQSIAALETEVRDVLHTYGPHDSVRSRRSSAGAPHSVHRPAQPVRREYELAPRDTASVASSSSVHRRRNPRDYAEVVDSRRHTRPVPAPAAVYHVPDDRDDYDADRRNAQASGGAFTEEPAPAKLQQVHREPQSQPQSQPRRPHRHATDTRDIERSLNELATSLHGYQQHKNEPRGPRRGERDADLAYSTRQQQQQQRPPSQQGSRPSSRHSHRERQPHSGGGGQQQTWPSQFLDSATLHKKGQPHRLGDPHSATAADRLTIDVQTQRSVRSAGSDSHRSGSEQSYVLVASDEETDAHHRHGLVYASSAVNRESPAPRNPRSDGNASARETYFEF